MEQQPRFSDKVPGWVVAIVPLLLFAGLTVGALRDRVKQKMRVQRRRKREAILGRVAVDRITVIKRRRRAKPTDW